MSWSLASGDVLAHYRVLSPLGAGGMGQVYLAEDVRLGRKLALKVLSGRTGRDEQRLRRFAQEARTISALNHPNILTIYDIGEVDGVQFIATEYVEGATLRSLVDRGPLGVRQALDIGAQIGQALAAAHEAGVVHRDLKPENVMVRGDGYVKVLDFGLAKLTAADSPLGVADMATRLVETREGVVMGTFGYMSPEQVRGTAVDARADLFSLGVVLYEMVSGEAPFKGPTPADVIGAVLHRHPDPLATTCRVPESLDRIVATALHKDRDRRYQSGAQMVDELRSLVRTLDTESGPAPALPAAFPSVANRPRTETPEAPTVAEMVTVVDRAPAAARRRRQKRAVDSLAVLPLVNLSGDEDLEYLSDGITESLINMLSPLPRLRVMAHSTVFRYKGGSTDPLSVGRALGVRAVLAGRLARRRDGFAVSVELVDVDDGAQMWGTSIARPLADAVALLPEITQELTDALRLRLTRDERKRLTRRHTVHPEAYQLYLRGRYLLNKRTGEALKQARTLFEKAVVHDPAFALAYAGLADCCSLVAVSFRSSTVDDVIGEARTAALKSLQLDQGLAEGHASLAFVRFRFDWQWQSAEAEFRRAIELNPGHAPTRQWHAMYLASQRRFDPALAEMRHALELDPLSLIIQTGIGRILHFAGRYDEAVRQFEHVLETNPGFPQAHVDLALTRLATGAFGAARAALDRASELFGPVSTVVLLRGLCAVREGRLDEGRQAYDDLRARYEAREAGPDDLALMAAALGDWERAHHWLQEACSRRSPFLGYVNVEPAMAPLLQDAGCRTLLERHGFGG